MYFQRTSSFLVCLMLFTSVSGLATEDNVSGVFGLDPMPEDAALAVWVPLDSDESIEGILWYNNDGSKYFSEVLAVAGSSQYPAVLDQALVVGENVSGVTTGWSEFYFSSPLASATPGLFVVFRLPEDGAFVSEGVGSGVGYQIGDGQIRSWVSTGEGDWGMLSPNFQMAVSPIMNSDKSGEVIVLGLDESQDPGQEELEMPIPIVPEISSKPNPFNPKTEISFSLPAGSDVQLTVYDLKGYKVIGLVSEFLPAGEHSVEWDGKDSNGRSMSSGVYLCQLKAGLINMTRRLTLVR